MTTTRRDVVSELASSTPVSDPDPVAPSAAALKLVVSAERLFAKHGIDGVSLRQIANEAGSSNNSAVHYYFGSKRGLIVAIFRHRLPQLISERRLLAARSDPDDLRSQLEAHFLPVLSLAEATDNHYVSFVEQLQRHDLGARDGLLELPAEGVRSNDTFRAQVHHLLSELPELLREVRIAEAQVLCIHAAADRERTVTSGLPSVPFELFASALLDGIAGFLSAPATESTLGWLRRAGDVDLRAIRLL
jgi:AcrR family transcriptional regulator